MKKTSRHTPLWLRAVAALLVPIQVATATPALWWLSAVQIASAQNSASLIIAASNPPQEEEPVTPAVEVDPPIRQISFSSHPTTEEISQSNLLPIPLVPAGQPSDVENQALAAALTVYRARTVEDEFESLTGFLNQYPESPWRLALLTNLGVGYFKTGHFSKAMNAWENAWQIGKGENDRNTKAIADRAIGELAKLNARLGRFDQLEIIFAELDGRTVSGSATELMLAAKEGLVAMKTRPERSFRCGPMALNSIRASINPASAMDPLIHNADSTSQGTSLVQVCDLSAQVGMNYQMAKREPGAAVVVPSVVNWKLGHYAALVREANGLYLIQDPTFEEDFWISKATLDDEGSGYFLIPPGELQEGWTSVSPTEGGTIWGKGATASCDQKRLKPNDKKSKDEECSTGMPVYNMHTMLVSLNIEDTPVGYTPPRGYAIDFKVTYNQREASQYLPFTYSNFGPKWTFNWLSYIVVNTTNTLADITEYVAGGGSVTYKTSNGTLFTSSEVNGTLTKVSASRFERLLPDGSIRVFNVPDNITGAGHKLFMGKQVDPAGNTVTLTYDASYRLTKILDEFNKETVIKYSATDPLKIIKVTDPFARSATFEYNAEGQLSSITDVVGMTSTFTYGRGDFIDSMTTPYGTTRFAYGDVTTDPTLPSTTRWLEIVDPLGAKERLEYRNSAPGMSHSEPTGDIPSIPGVTLGNSILAYHNSFYWDKKAMAKAPGDYTKARITHWLHTEGGASISGVPASEKSPLERRVWYVYPNQLFPIHKGASENPIAIARKLDDGTTQLYQFEYNSLGKITRTIDPVGRSVSYVYASTGAGKDIDLLDIRQTTGSSNDLLLTFRTTLTGTTSSYNTERRPTKMIDAAGQATTFSYNTSGQLLTSTVVRNGVNETTTLAYTSGFLTSITGPLSGAVTTLAYDTAGRIAEYTDQNGYKRIFQYDNLDRPTRITYPDGTFERVVYNRLDAEWVYDRAGRWTHYLYDRLRRLTVVEDSLMQRTRFDWCGCGALDAIIDAKGQRTEFTRDIQSRVTAKKFADGSETTYAYDATTSRLKSLTDAKGQRTNYTYFLDNNLQQVTYTDANGGALTPATPGVSFTYDTNYNRILTMADGTGTTTYAYNPITGTVSIGAGQLASIDGPLADDTIAFNYDELGRTKGRAINGTAYNLTFDSLGRVTGITNPLGSFTNTYVGATFRPASVTYPNGQSTEYSYFTAAAGDLRLQEIKNLSSGTSVLSKFNYTYDKVGNIENWTKQLDTATTTSTFGYDAINQLLSATQSGASTEAIKYQYDPVGNRTLEQIGSAVTQASFNNLNQLTSRQETGSMVFEGNLSEPGTVTYSGSNTIATDGINNRFRFTAPVTTGSNTIPVAATDASGNTTNQSIAVTVTPGTSQPALEYDLNGNLINDGTRTFEWDAANRLVAVNQSGNIRTELTYDGLSRWVRIEEKTNGNVTSTKNLVWTGLEIAEERDAGNAVTKRYYPQGVQIGAANYFYTRDHLGSIREVTDDAKMVQARYDYDPYGRRTKIDGGMDADFGFTGHYEHIAIGLTLAPYRAYDADFGKWLSRDPIGEVGGINLYNYVENDPVNTLDVLGLAPGDPYPTEQAAAEAGMAEAYNKTTSVRSEMQREYGGNVYLMEDGKHFSYTALQPGELNSGKVTIKNDCPSPKSRVAEYHSHPSWGLSQPSDLVDRNGKRYGDVPNAKNTGRPQYNIGGDGRMWRANPNGTVDYLGQK